MTELIITNILAGIFGTCTGILIHRFLVCNYVNKVTVHLVNCWTVSGVILLSYYGGYFWGGLLLVVGVFEGIAVTKAIELKKILEEKIKKKIEKPPLDKQQE